MSSNACRIGVGYILQKKIPVIFFTYYDYDIVPGDLWQESKGLF